MTYDWLQYKDFEEFCEKEKLKPEEALRILLDECERRGMP